MSQTATLRCTGCDRIIDPLYDAPITDREGQPWHPTCRTYSAGAQDTHDGGAGPLAAWAILTLIIPLVGIVAGIVYLFRNKIGPGLALLATAGVVMCAYLVLLSS